MRVLQVDLASCCDTFRAYYLCDAHSAYPVKVLVLALRARSAGCQP